MKSKLFTVVTMLLSIAAVVCTAFVIWAGFHYMHTDPRFNVRKITVMGLKRVDEDDVTARIQLKTDRDTNIFAVDMNDVRTHVEQIQRVRYAMVQRVLPDQIVIKIVERDPIGLARIQGRIYEFDSDAVILDSDLSATPNFPILVGMNEGDTEGNLGKIAIYSKAIEDLGAAGLSEIIVNQSNEVSVVKDEESVVVNLGVDNFKERWSHYLALKDTISADYKDAVRVDLRFRNKIIVSTQDDDGGGKVIWDGKKKSL